MATPRLCNGCVSWMFEGTFPLEVWSIYKHFWDLELLCRTNGASEGFNNAIFIAVTGDYQRHNNKVLLKLYIEMLNEIAHERRLEQVADCRHNTATM